MHGSSRSAFRFQLLEILLERCGDFRNRVVEISLAKNMLAITATNSALIPSARKSLDLPEIVFCWQ